MELMTSFTQFTAKTAGRDKLMRTVQYAAKLIGHMCKERGSSVDVITRLKKLEATISTSRKTFRLWKSVDMIRGAMKGAHIRDPVICACVVVSRLARTIYFVYDMIVWYIRAAVVNGDSKIWAQRGAPFWFFAVLFCLLRDLYELALFVKKREGAKEKHMHPAASESSIVSSVIAEYPQLALDTLKNATDLLIPLQLWGKIEISQGKIGLLGVISSICGIVEILSPHLKLMPM